MRRRAVRSKRWCFTLNNPTEAEEQLLHLQSLTLPQDWSYLITGKELGASLTPHLQGYLELRSKKTLRGLKRCHPILQRAHLEVAKGNGQSNREYCSKDGTNLNDYIDYYDFDFIKIKTD